MGHANKGKCDNSMTIVWMGGHLGAISSKGKKVVKYNNEMFNVNMLKEKMRHLIRNYNDIRFEINLINLKVTLILQGRLRKERTKWESNSEYVLQIGTCFST